jgi:putative ABC transport system permease protein
VLKLVMGRGLKLALLGSSIGIVASFVLLRLLSTLLIGVSATDPVTFGLVVLLLLIVALVACLLPARRATKVDPLVALKEE